MGVRFPPGARSSSQWEPNGKPTKNMPEKTPQPQSEKKRILTPEDRLSPELRAELESLFRDAMSTDTIPSMAALHYTLTHAGLDLSEDDERRLFWELVGNELVSSALPEIQGKLEPLVHEGKAVGLERKINLLAAETVKKLSPITYKLHEKREVAVWAIKRKLTALLPEHLRAAIEREDHEALVQARKQAAERLEQGIKRSREEAMRDFFAPNPENTVERCTWEIPDPRYVRPGAILKIQYSSGEPTEEYEILEGPNEGPNGRWIIARLLYAESDDLLRSHLLAQFGMEPYPDGRWDKTCRPVRCGLWRRSK